MKDCRFGYNVTSYDRAVKKGRLVVINCTVALSAIVAYLQHTKRLTAVYLPLVRGHWDWL